MQSDPPVRPEIQPPRRWLGHVTEPALLFPAFGLIALVILWGVIGKLIRSEQQAAEQAAASSSLELVDTYESQVVRAIREIDQTLKVVKYAYEAGGSRDVFEELRPKALLPPALLFTVYIATADGDVIASTQPVDAMNLAGRPSFEQARALDELSVGRPQPGVNAGDWIVFFARRLDAPDGSFAGVAALSVGASYFVSGYDETRLGRHGMLGILGSDGAFLVRRSGTSVSAGDLANYDATVAIEEGPLDAELDSDGVWRYRSARALYGLPLAVVVGLSRDEQLAPVRRDARNHLLQATAGSVLLIALTVWLGRMSWLLARARERESEERLAHAQRVEYLAYHDGLTTLPNRSLFTRLLEQAVQQAQRHQRKLALLFLDLDRFKHVNDTLGHEAGDQLLQEVAQRLKGALRESDTVARLGGDEFVVLLMEVGDRKHVAAVARKLIAAVGQPFVLHGQECAVGASIGIAVYPDDGRDEQTLTKNADAAMYQTKIGGRNGFQFFTMELHSSANERLALETALRHALSRHEMRLHYQAKREMLGGRISGMEALLRWEHPELGTVAPEEFMAIAEETGLILQIGRWAIRAACLQNVAWQREGLPHASVSLNLSAHQFANVNLQSDIAAILEETGIAPEYLELEVDESVLMRDVESAMHTLTRLRELGVRVGIDRFGAGYSTLSNLGRFPVDTIKIDRSCIRGIAESVSDRKLTDAIIALGRSLSVNVVGHGVETQEQADVLRDQACPELQGYYFDRPLPASEFGKLLEAEKA